MGLIKLPNDSIEYFKNNLDEIFASGNFAEGQWNKKLADFVANLSGAKVSIPTSSNGAGLVSLMSLYRHYHNRKNVMIQSNTMYGVKTMIGAAGCSLAGFIDCKIESLMPSFNDVKNAISKVDKKDKKSLILLLSHIGGIINPDIKKISELCIDENIILLEDCAHSFGSTLNGEHSGLFGDAGVYSFYATKAIPAGEGGVVVTNDERIGKMVSDFSIYDRFKQKLEIGNNIRISEVQALLTFSAVKEWKNIFLNKQVMATKYINFCNDNNINYISQNENGQIGNYYKFIIYTQNEPISEYFKNLKSTTSAVYDYSIGTKNSVANYHKCLPIWYGQDEKIVDKVISELK